MREGKVNISSIGRWLHAAKRTMEVYERAREPCKTKFYMALPSEKNDTQKRGYVQMEKVADLEVYVQRMQKSFMDKMFFIDKIFEPIDTILDFGCANGVLIRAMQYLFPEYEYIGYDISEDMIRKAKELLPECKFYKEWNEIAMDPKETLINISSTLHEVYSYGTEASVAEFWERIFGSGFKYIAIRDMMVSENASGKADPADVERARKFSEIFGLSFQINNDLEKKSSLEDKQNQIFTAKDIIGIEKTILLLDNYKEDMREMIKDFPQNIYKEGLEDLINSL